MKNHRVSRISVGWKVSLGRKKDFENQIGQFDSNGSWCGYLHEGNPTIVAEKASVVEWQRGTLHSLNNFDARLLDERASSTCFP